MAMKPGRNDPCPCGSGKKYKHCCGAAPAAGAESAPGRLAQSPPPARDPGALVALIGEGRLAEAERSARALLETQPDAGLLWKILSVALVRQGKDALQPLRRAAELLPEDAEAHVNLGAALHDRGHWAEALASLERSLALRPEDAQTLIDGGNALRGLRRAREAVAFYERALRIEPHSAEAHNNLGNARLELGEVAAAAASYRRAIELTPGDAAVHCNLGNALRQLGELKAGAAASERALALDPRLAMAHNNLGLCLAGCGERQRAAACYRRALELDGTYVEALNNLGDVLRELGDRRGARAACGRALELDPRRPEAHVSLGLTLFELRQLDAAVASFRRALELRNDDAAALLGLAAALRIQGARSEAETACRTALASAPQNGAALLALGELAADRGRFAEAQQLFERALASDPALPLAYCGIAAHRRMTGEDGTWRAGVEALLAKPLPLGQEIALRYALGKYNDDTGRYDEAFESYRQANELTRRYGARYERARFSERVERLMHTFDGAAIAAAHAGASDSKRPLFIVGMPRSGTSLAEQILASHPAVYGAGELRFWDAAFERCMVAGDDASQVEALIPALAREYLEHAGSGAAGAQRVVDKMPANFLYAGLIHAVFPRARIIHMQRHPIDTCLSIYFQNFFNTSPYTNDFGDLAHYYQEYLRIMRHWRAVLPQGVLLEVPYEALVEDPESWSRRMVEFAGLPWDARCLKFEETERVVLTASRWQVRQKISRASAGRWRNYEKYVGPLRGLAES
jgi:tetratricopeptide (TPR) repeat protein